MQQREKIYLAIFVTLIALWGVHKVVERMVYAPIDARKNRIAALESSVSRKEDQEIELLQASAKLGEWKQRSLPPVARDAQRLYQEWLTELAVLSGFANEKITPQRTQDEGNTYALVSVTVSGDATVNQVCEFLYRFHRANLLHRIGRIELKSSGNEGNPRLSVSLRAEGLSVFDAPDRSTLFPQGRLVEGVTSESPNVTVRAGDDFPEHAGFFIRIGREYLKVTGIEKSSSQGTVTWAVERGADFSLPAEHDAESTVQMASVHPDYADRTLDDYRLIVEKNPFAKPPPKIDYDPRIDPVSAQVVERGGGKLELTVTVSDFNPALGEPEFRFTGDVPDGLRIDRATGKLAWQPEEDFPLGEYEAVVEAVLPGSQSSQLSETIRIRVRDPNNPPVLAEIENQTAVLGRTLRFPVTATDEDQPEDVLTFSLGSGAPSGATIDSETGEFEWTPSESTSLGDYNVTIRVEDSEGATDSQTVRVRLIDDLAQFTKLTGCVAKDDRWQAMLYDQRTPKMMYLAEGDRLQYAEFDTRVLSIHREYMILQDAEGTWRLNVGANLRSMKQIETAAVEQE